MTATGLQSTRARLRVAYVYRRFSRRGSIPSFFVQRAERLARDETVTVVCGSAKREGTEAPLHFETVEPLTSGAGRIRYAAECASFAWRATKWLRGHQTQFDVIHIDGFSAWEADLVTVHAVRPAEVDHYFRNIEPDAMIRRRLAPVIRPQTGVVMVIERRLFRSPFPICLPVSNAVADDLQRQYGVPSDLIEIVPYGVDCAHFAFNAGERARVRRDLGVDDDSLVMLFVGDDFKRKGLERAIAGIAAAETTSILLVVGGGDIDRFRARARAHGIAERVHFLGRLTQARTPSLYSAADALLLPSQQDAWGQPVTEAMAAGRTVIVSQFTGAHEIITEGVNGFVLSGAGSPREIAAIVDETLSDRSRRMQIGASAKEVVGALDHERIYLRFKDAHHRAFERRAENKWSRKRGGRPSGRSRHTASQ